MLHWAFVFFIVSVIAGFFGFSGIAAGSALLAKTLFFLAMVLFAIFLTVGLSVGRALTKE